MGRPARGVRGMELDEGDYLVGMEVVEKDGLHSFDFRKRVRQADATDGLPAHVARTQGRHQYEDHAAHRQSGGDSVGEGRFGPDDHHQAGQIIRIDSSEIRQAGRSTQGVRLVNVEAGDQVAAASLIPEADPSMTNGQDDLPLQ